MLSTADERIVEQLKNFKKGNPPKPDDIIVIDPEIADTFDVDFQDFMTALGQICG